MGTAFKLLDNFKFKINILPVLLFLYFEKCSSSKFVHFLISNQINKYLNIYGMTDLIKIIEITM